MTGNRAHAAPALVAIALLLIAAAPANSPTETRRYQIQQFGFLHLEVPKSWPEKAQPASGRMPTTLEYAISPDAELEIVVLPNFDADPEFGALPRVREAVAAAARQLLPTAVETEVRLQEINGRSDTGYFYSLTDKSLVGRKAEPGNYRFVLQGQLAVGEFLVLFTILSNEKNSAAHAAAMHVVRTAIQAPEG